MRLIINTAVLSPWKTWLWLIECYVDYPVREAVALRHFPDKKDQGNQANQRSILVGRMNVVFFEDN